MPFPTASIATTNLDAGADSPASARADLKTAVDQLNAMRDWFGDDETALAVAATVDIGGGNTQRVALTSGSGAISSLGTVYSAGMVAVRVAVACSLTHNATTLVCPGGVNLTLAAGDWFLAVPRANPAAGWLIVPAPWTGKRALNGATPHANAALALGRVDSSAEGGQLDLHRASDNARAFGIDVYTDGVEYLRILDLVAGAARLQISSATGYVMVGTSDVPTAPLDVSGNTIRLRTSRTPASASASGNAGDICWDASYVYVCIATNTWRRMAHATW